MMKNLLLNPVELQSRTNEAKKQQTYEDGQRKSEFADVIGNYFKR